MFFLCDQKMYMKIDIRKRITVIFCATGILSVVGLVVFWQPLLRCLQDFDFRTMNDFLSTILVWHITIPVFALMVILMFFEEIKALLKRVSRFRAGSFEFQAAGKDREGASVSEREKELKKEIYKLRDVMDDERFENDRLIKTYDKSLENAFEMAEFWEFQYLALLWGDNMKWMLRLVSQWKESFTRDFFMSSCIFPSHRSDHMQTKEGVFGSFIKFGFIIQQGNVFVGTEKIQRFLRHIDATI